MVPRSHLPYLVSQMIMDGLSQFWGSMADIVERGDGLIYKPPFLILWRVKIINVLIKNLI